MCNRPSTIITRLSVVLGGCLWLGLSAPAAAVIFKVELTDNDGPSITGSVNTITDSFSIDTWVENPGGSAFWTPTSLPLVWLAQTAGGATFDVPDMWDGSISASWGFLSPSFISWNEGIPPTAGSGRPGWGIGDFPVSSSTDETIFQSIPVSATNRAQVVFDSVSVVEMPEPELASLILLVFAGLCGSRAFRRRFNKATA